MSDLIARYIEKFGGIPWRLYEESDEVIEKELTSALETGIPCAETEYRDNAEY